MNILLLLLLLFISVRQYSRIVLYLYVFRLSEYTRMDEADVNWQDIATDWPRF